jgi:hypothetical protein
LTLELLREEMEQLDVWDFGFIVERWQQTRYYKALTNERGYKVNSDLPTVPFQEKKKRR